MTESRFERFAPLAGVVFYVLVLLGVATQPDEPEFVDEPAKLVEYYRGEDDGILVSNSLFLLSVPFLLWFVGSLRHALRSVEGSEGRIAGVALAAGAAGSARMLAGASADIVGALRVQERDAIDPAVATVLNDLANVLFGLAAPMAFAALVFATALLGFRRGAVPVWLAVVSVILGIALLIPPINWASMIIFVFWVPVVAVLLYLRGAPRGAGDRASVVGGAGEPG